MSNEKNLFDTLHSTFDTHNKCAEGCSQPEFLSAECRWGRPIRVL